MTQTVYLNDIYDNFYYHLVDYKYLYKNSEMLFISQAICEKMVSCYFITR